MDWVWAIALLIIGLVLLTCAGMFPYPFNVVIWIVAILALVSAVIVIIPRV